MTNHLDSALRDALADLADAPAPAGLAAAAIRIARRRHRRRVGLATAGVVVALMVTPVATSTGGDGSTTAAEASTMEPLVITAYSLGGEGSMLLDHRTGEYVDWPYRGMAPSPDGAYALVRGGGDAPPGSVGVLGTGTGEVRWIDSDQGAGGDSPGGWSPDGEQLLITQPGGFSIVDPDTLQATFVELDDIDDPEINAMRNRLVWAPGGDEIALTQSVDAAEPADRVTAIRFYDLDGNLTRTVPASAALTSEAGFSPDGTRMALQNQSIGQPIQVIDATTGAELQTVPVPPSLLIGWADSEHLIVRLELTLLVANLAGEVTWPAPMEVQSPDAVYVGSSDGFPREAARFTFGVDAD